LEWRGYCGLCGAERSSGERIQRTPLSKQRSRHLQTILIEAANRATLAVARKMVAYLVAVDRRQTLMFYPVL
jgi:transposase